MKREHIQLLFFFFCLSGGVPAAPFGGDPGAGAPAMYGRGGGAPGKEE